MFLNVPTTIPQSSLDDSNRSPPLLEKSKGFELSELERDIKTNRPGWCRLVYTVLHLKSEMHPCLQSILKHDDVHLQEMCFPFRWCAQNFTRYVATNGVLDVCFTTTCHTRQHVLHVLALVLVILSCRLTFFFFQCPNKRIVKPAAQRGSRPTHVSIVCETV